MSNSPRNGPELAKTVSVDDGHVNAPRGSSIVEIALEPKMLSNSARNGLESSIMEITLGPKNG